MPISLIGAFVLAYRLEVSENQSRLKLFTFTLLTIFILFVLHVDILNRARRSLLK